VVGGEDVPLGAEIALGFLARPRKGKLYDFRSGDVD
jgi:hypothetical protein